MTMREALEKINARFTGTQCADPACDADIGWMLRTVRAALAEPDRTEELERQLAAIREAAERVRHWVSVIVYYAQNTGNLLPATLDLIDAIDSAPSTPRGDVTRKGQAPEPDPRDAEVASLREALRHIKSLPYSCTCQAKWIADAALAKGDRDAG